MKLINPKKILKLPTPSSINIFYIKTNFLYTVKFSLHNYVVFVICHVHFGFLMIIPIVNITYVTNVHQIVINNMLKDIEK